MRRWFATTLLVVFFGFGATLAGQGLGHRASTSLTGGDADSMSLEPGLSSNGRFVVFQSYASNLVADDTNGCSDVFVHDCITGTTVRVSVSSSGAQGNFYSGEPAISADGRFIAFRSEATNLVPGDTNGVSDVFVHERITGRTYRVSTGTQAPRRTGPAGDRRFRRRAVSSRSNPRPAISFPKTGTASRTSSSVTGTRS